MCLCLFHRLCLSLCLRTCKDEQLADKKKKGVPHQQSPSSQESTTKLKTMEVLVHHQKHGVKKNSLYNNSNKKEI